MDFTVFECTRTHELCEAACEEGFDSWVPMIGDWELLKRRGKPDEWVWKMRVVPGYIYVPKGNMYSFRRWAGSRYNVEMMTTFRGKPMIFSVEDGTSGTSVASLPTLHRQKYLEPATVPLKELHAMDAKLREDTERNRARMVRGAATPEAAPTPAFEVNDRVEVYLGIFKGLCGKVVAIKRDGVRIQVGARFVTMSGSFMQKI